MKLQRIILTLIPVLFIAGLIGMFPATAQAEEIRSFTSSIEINTDGSMQVTEYITYDFGIDAVDRHGIFRNIPYVKINQDGKQYEMDIRIESITNRDGRPYPFDISKEDKKVNLKIGDPDETVVGAQTYVIQYTVKGAITYFSDHDELYWNVTGNEWNVPINRASATVTINSNQTIPNIKAICYTGYTGSTEQNCTTSVRGNTTEITTTGILGTSEGLTFATRFPKNIVAVVEPKPYKEFWETWWGIALLVLLALAAIFWYILYPLYLPFKWFMYGRDPDVGRPATAWFDPPKTKSGRPLTPAETGALIDEQVEVKDIAGLMVNLAQRGHYIIIEKEEGDFEFKKHTPKKKDTVLPFEQMFLDKLFKGRTEVRLKDLKLADTVEKIRKDIYADMTKEGFFPEDPHKIKMYYGGMLGAAGMTFNIPLLITGSIFGLNMARKTKEGAQAMNVAKALKNFLSSQERQLNFQGDKQLMFEKLLPFAVAFGVERKWAERFRDIELKEPSWYQGYYSDSFSPSYFANSVHSSVNQLSSVATPTTSSSGFSSGFSGGSSGGGGGGGGGGSW